MITLKVDENGELRLTAEALESIGLEPGDRVNVASLDGTLTLCKSADGTHPFANWRAISHSLIAGNSA